MRRALAEEATAAWIGTPFLSLQWNPSPPPRDVPFSGIIISPLKVGCRLLLILVLNVCICVSVDRNLPLPAVAC